MNVETIMVTVTQDNSNICSSTVAPTDYVISSDGVQISRPQTEVTLIKEFQTTYHFRSNRELFMGPHHGNDCPGTFELYI